MFLQMSLNDLYKLGVKVILYRRKSTHVPDPSALPMGNPGSACMSSSIDLVISSLKHTSNGLKIQNESESDITS